ncbi:MAG: HD domain-containing protein, partial [Syntrophales bacterium LBB04]|nr:HD domain-containing protein [Syntrophales bacterium LBB04]
IFQKIAELALKIVNGESCVLFLYDEESDEFYPKITKDINVGNSLPVIKSLFKNAVDRKEALIVHSLSDPAIRPSVICAPLMIRGNVLGVLSIRKKRDSGIFTRTDLNHMVSLAKRAALNLENKILYESIYSNLMDTFKALVASIQMRDLYTEEHSLRVSDLAVRIAKSFNCTRNEIESLKIASLLHDIGKISIPDNILLKAANLTNEEYQTMRNHPGIGEEILSPVLLLDKERKIIRHHHERWDGSGYPNGLAGNKIPLLARILAVADSFDAMTNDRPYRKAMSTDLAVEELKKNANRQFDNDIVNAFVGMR